MGHDESISWDDEDEGWFLDLDDSFEFSGWVLDLDVLVVARKYKKVNHKKVVPMQLPNPSHGAVTLRVQDGIFTKIMYEDGFVREKVGSVWIN